MPNTNIKKNFKDLFSVRKIPQYLGYFGKLHGFVVLTTKEFFFSQWVEMITFLPKNNKSTASSWIQTQLWKFDKKQSFSTKVSLQLTGPLSHAANILI